MPRQQHHIGTGGWSRRVSRFVFAGFVATALFFLVTEHRAHLIQVLPYLLLAACPLMHWFHHHGRDRRGGSDSDHRSPPDGA